MSLEIAIIISSVIIGVAITLLLKKNTSDDSNVSQNIISELRTLKEEMGKSTSDHRKEVQERLDRVHDQLAKSMTQSHNTIQQQFKQSSEADSRMRKTIQEITQAMTEVKSTNKQVLDFSAQLQDLQNILKNPKQRGVLGEYWLETLLSNVLPIESYKMQHAIGEDEKTGKKLIADATIFIRDQFIAIDAKFSLENYNRVMQETDQGKKEKLERALKADVKNRIDETAKYIKPELGTMNFAFMFIPAEGVYYNLLNADIGSGINSVNLVEYAFSKHVMIVSPTSFYAYLQTVLLGLRELQLEKSTQEIIKRVGELGKHFRSYSDYHSKLGKNLGTVVNQFNQSSGELKKVSKDVSKITSGSLEDVIEIEEEQKPITD
jgi:DNA recombination protein RmuC